jgi:hypothetical protein
MMGWACGYDAVGNKSIQSFGGETSWDMSKAKAVKEVVGLH